VKFVLFCDESFLYCLLVICFWILCFLLKVRALQISLGVGRMLLSMVSSKDNIKMDLQGCGRVANPYATVGFTVIRVYDYLSGW
jgi:hypothetical protein